MFEFTLACLGKEEYVCPSDAGPAWRAAHEMGHNMFELERNLLLTQEDRLDKHNKKLAEWLEFEALMAVLHRRRICNTGDTTVAQIVNLKS